MVLTPSASTSTQIAKLDGGATSVARFTIITGNYRTMRGGAQMSVSRLLNCVQYIPCGGIDWK